MLWVRFMSDGKSKVRRSLDRIRRRRSGDTPQSADRLSARGEVGWDHDAQAEPGDLDAEPDSPLPAQILSLFSEPTVTTVTTITAARALGRPRVDVETAIAALVQAGELYSVAEGSLRYTLQPERKAQLEAMFRESAHELGETRALVLREAHDVTQFEEDEEPRLPVTAGLLSLFLPGTGQLLNGDVGRASLVFAVWSLALLTNLYPIWIFVMLYAGAEAFFTAKVRGMERKLALETGPGTGGDEPVGRLSA